MKAIAEYFRDLAADDRFFGAEPPQPDTEMLHKIAERTIQRRVAAELAENGVILRQTETPEQPASERPALAVEAPQAPAEPDTAVAPQASETRIPADVPVSPQPTPARAAEIIPPASAGGDTVAEKLQRIRAVVARENATTAYSEDQHAAALTPSEPDFEDDAPSAFFDSTGAGFETDAPVEDVVEPEIADTAPAFETPVEDEAESFEDVTETAPADESMEVSEDDTPEVAEDAEAETFEAETYEDEPAEYDDADTTAEVETEADAFDAAAENTEAEAEDTEAYSFAEETSEAEAAELDVTEDVADVETSDEQAEAADAEAEMSQDDTAEVEEEVELVEDHAETEMEADSAADETLAETPTEEAEDDAAAEDETSEQAAEETADADADQMPQDDTEALAAEEDAPTLQTKLRRRIVVQRISRADMEAAKAAQEAELPPELEAELMAELAEVEAEAETPILDDTAEDAVEAESAEDETTAEFEVEVEAEEATAEETPSEDDAAQEQEQQGILARLSGMAYSIGKPKAEEPETEAVAETDDAQEDDRTDDVLKGLLDAQSDDTDTAEVETPEAATEETPVETAETEEVALEVDDEDDVPARKTLAAEAEDEAIERLMSTTSSRLDHDESSVRRASIAHLKAAVAATKADASIAEAAGKREEEEMDQYRDDLARVVKPSRPRPASGRGERSADRPSPLVLVSEQRIDRPEEAPQEAAAASLDVRPRRVTAGNLALQEDEEYETEESVFDAQDGQISYPEFAAKAGALELPDLLEAAAAHYMVVEGAEHFTRPMLMRKLATIQGPDAPSREDGLRAFGSLLRTGKIVKTDNGKFVLAKGSRFVDEAH